MKKAFLQCAVILFLALGAGQSVLALGLGVNRTYGTEVLPPYQPYYPTFLDRIMDRIEGIDIVYDTAVAKDRLFNYRANIECYTTTEETTGIYSSQTRNARNIVFAHTFGFGFVRTRFMRIWAGPQIALACQFVNRNNTVYDPVLYSKFGAIVGANIHTTDHLTIGLEIGVRTGFGFELTRSLTSSFTSAKLEPIAGLKLIFRAGDSFSSAM